MTSHHAPTPTNWRDILYDPAADPSVKWFRGELGAVVTWEHIDVFRLLAVLS